MKIIHLACVAPPEIGGIGVAAMREVSGLRAVGEDATLIAPEVANHNSTNVNHDRSFLHRVKPLFRFGNASMLTGLRDQLKRADVIHLHYPFYGTAEPILMSARNLPPIVVTFHMDATAKGWTGWMMNLHRWLIQPWILPSTKRVLVSSFDYARQSSLRNFFRKHPERVEELPLGVDTHLYSPGPSRRERFLVPEDAPCVLFVGGLDAAHAFKGVELLLEAMTKLDAKTHLLIVGDGDRRVFFEDLARTKGIAERVHFLGRIDDASVVDAYRTADVLAFPSTSAAEAFGLVALEAQACGKPVVASDLPGVRTVVKRDETGKLVPVGDMLALSSALRDILSDAELRERLGRQARVHAEAYAWDRHIDRLREIYKNVCASRS